MFKVGQKVVCTGDFSKVNHPGVTFPEKGEIYTVRSFRNDNDKTGICLEEIVNPIMEWSTGLFEPAFDILDFRPIDYSFGEQVCESLEVMTEPELV